MDEMKEACDPWTSVFTSESDSSRRAKKNFSTNFKIQRLIFSFGDDFLGGERQSFSNM
ncbi:unnamed protein product [Sphenostylis stenocarpa]|uniref:Uncharacterized protein n=1 Tax=Sphenostylis stenocarpa TaxID=92480 RepID=A0AA86VKP3_9FABA|nr:unnamed protein product [Sphenostylis stenocarpa]